MQDQILMSVADPQVKSDDLCDKFYVTMLDIIGGTFSPKKSSEKKKFPSNKWFNDKCKHMKKQVNEYAKNFDISRSPFAEHFYMLESEYNKIKQKSKRQYHMQIRSKLENFNSKNPAAYWKLWKPLKPREVNNSKLTLNDFNNYFKDQIEPPDTSYFDHTFMSSIHE